MAYIPRVFTKNVWNAQTQTFSLQTRTADTIREDVELLFDGWTPGESLPDTGTDFATQAYVISKATEIAHNEALIISKGDKGDTGFGIPEAGLLALATNLIVNPSGEVSVGSLSVNGGTGVAITRSTAQAKFGTASGKYVYGDTTTQDSGPALHQSTIPLTSGKTYTLSAWVYIPAVNGTTGGLRLFVYGSVVGSTVRSTVTTTTTGSWVRLWQTFTAAASANFTAGIGKVGDSLQTGKEFYYDGLMLHEGGVPLDYFDGSLPGARWTGTAHASTSELLVPSAVNTALLAGATGSTSLVAENLNTIATAGDYVAGYSADWAARNLPVGDGGFLRVLRLGATVHQSFYQHGATYNFHRVSTNSGSSWTAWLAEGKAYVDTHAAAADPHTVYAKKAGDTFTGAVQVHRTTPIVHVYNRTDLGVDAKRWDVAVENDGNYAVRAVNDAGGLLRPLLVMTRAGLVVLDGIHHAKGAGSPEAVVTAPVGSRYVDTAATNGAVEWIKFSGAGNTGWRPVYGDTGWRNISSSLLNGWTGTILINRCNDRVEMNLAGLVPGSATQVIAIPLGFRSNRNSNFILRSSSTGTDVVNGSYDTSGALHITLSSIVPNSNSHTIAWSANGLAWPVGALPGTAG